MFHYFRFYARLLKTPRLLFSGPVFAWGNPSLITKHRAAGVHNNEARSGMNNVKPVFPNHNGAVVVNNWSQIFIIDFVDICKYVL